MNDPIISPWIFYGLNVVDTILCIGTIFAVLLGILMTAAILIAWMDDDYVKRVERYRKTLFYLILVIWLGCALIPSRTTLIQMYIASKVTPANIQEVVSGQTTDMLINKIIEVSKQYEKKK